MNSQILKNKELKGREKYIEIQNNLL